MKIKCPLCPDEIYPYSENDLVDHIELHHYNRDSAKYIQNLLFKIHEMKEELKTLDGQEYLERWSNRVSIQQRFESLLENEK